MESWIRIFLLKPVLLLAIYSQLQACSFLRPDEPVYSDTDPVIQPDLERRTITEADIDSEDFEAGPFVGIMSVEDFGSNVVYGARVAYHITEDFFAEAAIGRTDTDKTSFEDLSGGAQILSNSERELTYYNISLGYNILPGEVFLGSNHTYNSALYVIGGVGNTDFADDNHFTVNVGAGYRLLVNDWISLRIDFRDHIFESDLLGSDKTLHNLEGTAGIYFFF